MEDSSGYVELKDLMLLGKKYKTAFNYKSNFKNFWSSIKK